MELLTVCSGTPWTQPGSALAWHTKRSNPAPNDPASVECKNHPSAALPRQSFSFRFRETLSCFSDIDFSICLEAPLRLDFGRFPRFAANAAPAAICCFFEVAGTFLFRSAVHIRPGEKLKRLDRADVQKAFGGGMNLRIAKPILPLKSILPVHN